MNRIVRRLVFLFFLVTTVLEVQSQERVAAGYYIDGLHSSLKFSLEYIEFMTLEGKVDQLFGYFMYDSQKIENSKLTVILKAKSMNTGMKNRDRDMWSKRYLGEKEHPSIVFRSNFFSKKGNTLYCNGTLTIKGVEKNVILPLKINAIEENKNEKLLSMSVGALKIKRSDFGIGNVRKTSLEKIFLSDEVTIWGEILLRTSGENELTALQQYRVVSVPRDLLTKYTGSYVVDGTEFSIELLDNSLFFVQENAGIFRMLYPIGNDKFIESDIGHILHFTITDTLITGITYQNGDKESEWWHLKRQ